MAFISSSSLSTNLFEAGPSTRLINPDMFDTCMCKLEEGEVDYVLEPLDPPDPGYALICCSKPETNVVVDV